MIVVIPFIIGGIVLLLTRIGEGILIGGGAFVVTGLGIILFSKNDGLGGGLLVAGGEFFGVVGGIFLPLVSIMTNTIKRNSQ